MSKRAGRLQRERGKSLGTRRAASKNTVRLVKAARKSAKYCGPGFRTTGYDLRHTYASLLLADGAPLTYVSAQLGHANSTTTLRHYARWMP